MSDFLDRLAARAIGSEAAGGETALVPRLPSLFEPLQRAPITPLPDDGEISPGHHETMSGASAPAIAPLHASHAPVAAATDARRVAPAAVEPRAALSSTRVAAGTPHNVTQPPASNAVAAQSSVVERVVTSTVSPELLAPIPVRPRQTRIAAEHTETAAPLHSPNGALLPASTPVFSAARAADSPGRSVHAASTRPPAAAAGSGNSSSETVVHVSIGRLEVRAAPAAALPPRRRDDPQPSSLDDYLRQRGKVSP